MPQDMIFVSTSNPFDVAMLRNRLDALPECFLPPNNPSWYFLCRSPETAQRRYEELLSDAGGMTFGCQVRLDAERVELLTERADRMSLRCGLEFARWLTSKYEVEVKNERGEDQTPQYRKQGIDSFFPEAVHSDPYPPWGEGLLKVGWFHELEHCDYEGVSLEKARSESPAPDEDRIAAYLDAGHLYIAATGFVEDWFADDEIMIGPPHLLTDGVYVWPADLPYYVRNYHVRLPKAFMIHVANNGYEMPKDVDVTRLKLS
ncbi:hypothetical protein Hoch_2241 [Haliangium ochraceum DSM 14365]|uniref:Uncharacterized protein n=2 Tax=Haliangium ochraceum TaxID=80816 RepID=D0LHV5_HALO1|nr:hypothetical protein Hoch_2241 [Haliangium ochraceum DSM 14365]